MLDIHVSDGGNLTIQQFNKIHTCLKNSGCENLRRKVIAKIGFIQFIMRCLTLLLFLDKHICRLSMYTYNVSKNHRSVFLGRRFQFYFMDLKKKCFEIVVITYNGKKGTD